MTDSLDQRRHDTPSLDTEIRHSTGLFDAGLRAQSLGILVLITLMAFEGVGSAAVLPTAARELHGLASYGWAFTGFLVANVVGMVVAGQLNDRTGPRAPLYTGLVAFVAGLVVTGSATGMPQFVAGRVAQGFGGGLMITSIYVMIGATYPEQVRPRIFALTSAAWIIPSLAGPPVAGLLAEHASWRWVYLGLAPAAFGGLALIARALATVPRPVSCPPLDLGRVLRAVTAALGVAALSAAGQHPSPVSIAAACAGLAGLVWAVRTLLPPGTFAVRTGVAAPVAMRGLLAGSLFGVDAMVPLTLTVQHGYAAVAASLPLASIGVGWAFGSWWQGRDASPDRVGLVRSGFAFVTIAAAGAAVISVPAVPGWPMYAVWALAGVGAGFTMSSVGVLLLNNTSDAERGRNSAALQLSDVVASALTTGYAGVLVAAAAHGRIGYTAAFVILDLTMAAIAAVGVAVAGRARSAAYTS